MPGGSANAFRLKTRTGGQGVDCLRTIRNAVSYRRLSILGHGGQYGKSEERHGALRRTKKSAIQGGRESSKLDRGGP